MNEESVKVGKTISIKGIPVILTIIYSIITLGIYYPCWFLTRREQINSLKSNRKIGKGVFIICLVLIAIALFLAFFSGLLEGIGMENANTDFIELASGVDFLSNILQFASFIIVIVQSLKLRKILIDHYRGNLQGEMSCWWILTFIFQIFYLQYNINRLQE